MKHNNTFIIYFTAMLLLISSLPVYAANLSEVTITGVEPTEENGDHILTLCGSESYPYCGTVSSDPITIVSGFVKGEEYYDDGTGEVTDTTQTGRHSCDIFADKSGYYVLEWYQKNDIVSDVVITKSNTDTYGGTYKKTETVLDKNMQASGVLFYLSENEHQYAAIEECNSGSYSLSLKYLGSITDVASVSDLVKNCGSDAYCEDESKTINMYPSLGVTFSEGTQVIISGYAQTDGTDINDSVSADVTVINETFNVQINLIEPADLIESISFPSGFEPSCIIQYDGMIYGEAFPDYIILNCSNGNRIKVSDGEKILLENGRIYSVFCQYDYGNEDGQVRESIKFGVYAPGLTEKEVFIRPVTESAGKTLKKILSRYKINIKTGTNILLHKGEFSNDTDMTYKDGVNMILSLFPMLVKACNYYSLSGKPPITFYIYAFLIAAAPVVLIVILVVFALIIKRKK